MPLNNCSRRFRPISVALSQLAARVPLPAEQGMGLAFYPALQPGITRASDLTHCAVPLQPSVREVQQHSQIQ
jgi:hypothetical protein